MRYSIVTCPRCGKNRVAESKSDTTGCPSCGKRFQLAGSRRLLETDSLEEARKALAVINSGDSGILDEMKKPEKVSGEIESLRSIADRTERAAAVARHLTSKNGDFTDTDFCTTAKDAGLKNPEKVLESLLDSGQAYEPKPGRYRAS